MHDDRMAATGRHPGRTSRCRGCSDVRAGSCSRSARGEQGRVALDDVPEPRFEAPEPVGLDAALPEALAALSHLDREALLLVAWEDLTPTQAAHALGINPVAFRVRLHRARRRCSSALDSRLDHRNARIRSDSEVIHG